jgi:hypothetical protein
MNPVPIDHLMMGGGIALIVGVTLLFLCDLLPGGWGEVARGIGTAIVVATAAMGLLFGYVLFTVPQATEQTQVKK